MSLHMELMKRINEKYSKRLDGEIVLKQDALLAQFDTGLGIEIRYLNSNEYSICWSWGDAEMRIDTTPIHKHLTTYPNHLHDSTDRLLPDPLTEPRNKPWDNIVRLLDRLLTDPLLESDFLEGECNG